jgi:hypothetical protein
MKWIANGNGNGHKEARSAYCMHCYVVQLKHTYPTFLLPNTHCESCNCDTRFEQ